jgi:regulator of RNase E activity RraA
MSSSSTELSAELIEAARSRLYSAVISDVLDGLGDTGHAMRPNVRPLDESLILFGRVRTGLYMEVYHVEEEEGFNPYELEIALVDDLKPGEIAVFACPDSPRVAPWGELLSTAARARGALGCVTDGLVRDVRLIREMQFPVFAGGIGPLDSKGRATVMKIDVPVVCGGVRVCSGDWIFADVDGVVVIPARLAQQAIELSLEKIAGEDTVREELAAGHPLREVFARHGIL